MSSYVESSKSPLLPGANGGTWLEEMQRPMSSERTLRRWQAAQRRARCMQAAEGELLLGRWGMTRSGRQFRKRTYARGTANGPSSGSRHNAGVRKEGVQLVPSLVTFAKRPSKYAWTAARPGACECRPDPSTAVLRRAAVHHARLGAGA
jgi:hypothetical protein